ncbi:MAG: phospho-sugar mutase [Clostridia bacterium]|nr:phospho-sugar mutase [Clostridia bacterium]
MKNYKDIFLFWKTDSFFDKDTQDELCAIQNDDKEIYDRFFQNLEFGTGGMRGIMGAGINRLNKYTVGRATQGFSNYLLNTYSAHECKTHGVVIAYDTRINSKYFAEISSNILSNHGIKVYLHTSPVPTPQLSFAVKHLNALAGIVITASHNPKEYNGYKIYDENGCQLVPQAAKAVYDEIEKITDYRSLTFERNKEYIIETDTTDAFVSAVLKESRNKDPKSLSVVYTPIHGSGKIPVKLTLEKDGFKDVLTVASQEIPDGSFPTVVSPNPEDRRALEQGIRLAEKHSADIVLGTDPDSDRVGVAVNTKDGFKLLSGNQIGALILDYIIKNTDLSKINKPSVVKTVVTSELGAKIASKNGMEVFSTLTGFKYIGEKIGQFEKTGHTFVFGYEESFGYLSGTHARDKDAVVSSMLICEAADMLKKQGKNLCNRLEELYSEYGYYLDKLESFTLPGADGIEKIKFMMKKLRENDFFTEAVKTDYTKDVPAEGGFGILPKSDVLKYTFKDSSWIAVRPSGTEPKIKIYYSIKEKNLPGAQKKFEAISAKIREYLELK